MFLENANQVVATVYQVRAVTEEKFIYRNAAKTDGCSFLYLNLVQRP